MCLVLVMRGEMDKYSDACAKDTSDSGTYATTLPVSPEPDDCSLLRYLSYAQQRLTFEQEQEQ
jgi:hypothetical protein